MKKRIRFFLILAVIFSLTLSGCQMDTEKSLSINGKTIKLEIADNEASQAKGLSNHKPLKKDEGMLFVFSEKQVQTFWMKDMNFNLDIIWIEDDTIVKISEDLKAEGEKPSKVYSSERPVNYVLEVNAGWAKENKIKVGDKVIYNL